jgi:two-component system phosphate regulon sensor histidine kinase PhoR
MDEKVLVEVSDNGPGIPKEDIKRIFERFYRVDKSRSKDSGGIGLGLAIVKHILEAHHQRIWVTSEMGKGSNFYFNLQKGIKEKALVEEAFDV